MDELPDSCSDAVAEVVIAVTEIVLRAGGVELSGLLAEPEAPPRGLVLALHGGGMRAGYFHGRAHPDLSLLTLGRRIGFTVLALDRPGYGLSRTTLPEGASLEDQATMVLDALDDLATRHPVGDGTFVVGHSYGLKLALHLAARPGGSGLLGLDGSGAVYRYRPDLAPGGPPVDEPVAGPRSSRELYWGHEGLYPAGTFDPGMRPVAEVPAWEMEESARWPDLFRALAPRVCLPYQFTVAEHEHWWQATDDDLAEYRGLLSAVPLLRIRRQPAAGHNISLGWAARSYHLSALAFAEQCLLVRRHSATVG